MLYAYTVIETIFRSVFKYLIEGHFVLLVQFIQLLFYTTILFATGKAIGNELLLSLAFKWRIDLSKTVRKLYTVLVGISSGIISKGGILSFSLSM